MTSTPGLAKVTGTGAHLYSCPAAECQTPRQPVFASPPARHLRRSRAAAAMSASVDDDKSARSAGLNLVTFSMVPFGSIEYGWPAKTVLSFSASSAPSGVSSCDRRPVRMPSRMRSTLSGANDGLRTTSVKICQTCQEISLCRDERNYAVIVVRRRADRCAHPRRFAAKPFFRVKLAALRRGVEHEILYAGRIGSHIADAAADKKPAATVGVPGRCLIRTFIPLTSNSETWLAADCPLAKTRAEKNDGQQR